MDDRPARPPSPGKEMHEALMRSLKSTIEAANAMTDLTEKSLILERCAHAFAHLDQAMSARRLAYVAEVQRRDR